MSQAGEGDAAGGNFCCKGASTRYCYFALLGMEYLRLVYRKQVWVQVYFCKPWGRGGSEAGTRSLADTRTGAGAAVSTVQQFPETLVERWNELLEEREVSEEREAARRRLWRGWRGSRQL